MTRPVAGRAHGSATQHAHTVFDRFARRALPLLFKLRDHTFKVWHAEHLTLRLVRAVKHIVLNVL